MLRGGFRDLRTEPVAVSSFCAKLSVSFHLTLRKRAKLLLSLLSKS